MQPRQSCRFPFVVAVIGLSFAVYGCGASAVTPSPTSVATSLPPTNTAVAGEATSQITPTPFETIVAPTASATPTIGVTPVPTLEERQQENYLLTLLAVNGGCNLPCFLSIMPGLSRLEDLRRVEGPIQYWEEYIPDSYGQVWLPFRVNQEGFLNLHFYAIVSNSDLIESIRAEAKIYLPSQPYHYPSFVRALERYSMQTLFGIHGVPSRILFRVQEPIEPGGINEAVLLVFHDDQGILVEYSFEDVVSRVSGSSTRRVCIEQKQPSYIRMYLQSANASTLLEELYDRGYTRFADLEERTSLQVAEFHTLVLESDSIPCFDVDQSQN